MPITKRRESGSNPQDSRRSRRNRRSSGTQLSADSLKTTAASAASVRLWTSDCLKPGQRNPFLGLILSLLILVTDLALIPFICGEEQHLRYPLIRVDFRRQRCGIRDFQRYKALPFRLKWRDIDDNSTSCICAFADANRQTVAWDAEVLHRAGQRERIGRHDAHIAREFDEGFRIEPFRIDHR